MMTQEAEELATENKTLMRKLDEAMELLRDAWEEEHGEIFHGIGSGKLYSFLEKYGEIDEEGELLPKIEP